MLVISQRELSRLDVSVSPLPFPLLLSLTLRFLIMWFILINYVLQDIYDVM